MAEIVLIGEVGYDITLYNVVGKVEQLRKSNELTELTVKITSEGGNSVEARNIYNYLKSLPFLIKTVAVDYVYSAGLTIFMAGFERMAESNETTFLMHSPFYASWFDYLNDEDLQEIRNVIADEKKELVKIYSAVTGIDNDTIISLMDNDSIINAETAKSVNLISGVLTETPETKTTTLEIINKFYVNENHKLLIKNHKQMEQKQIDKLNENLEKQGTILGDLVNKVTKLFKADIKNLDINTEEGQLLTITGEELVEGASVTNVDAGEFTVIYNDLKYQLVIEGGIITSLVDITEEVPEKTAPDEEMQAKYDALQNDYNSLKESYTALETKLQNNANLIEKFTKLTNKVFKDDGSIDFDGVEKMKPQGETMEQKLKNYAAEKRTKK